MAAAEIQVANPANLAKIESFLNDTSYKEAIESSSSFNLRLSAERRMRIPFIDTQTGVAQSHCHLFMTRKQRMPGLREGQVYSYPAQRWRKTRRQYLMTGSSRWGWVGAPDPCELPGEGENSSGVPGEALGGDDSRDGSQTATKDDPKEWFYDELAIEELETGEEPDPESDEDYYDDTYANRRKRRGGSTPSGPGSRGGRVRKSAAGDDTPGKRGRGGRGRKRAGQHTLPYEVPGDAEKPFGCELCGAKYKTRPGLTYHFTHTHKDPSTAATSDGDSRDSKGGGTPTPPVPPPNPTTEYQDSYVTFLNKPPLATAGVPAVVAGVGPVVPPRRPTPPPRPASADTSSCDSAPAVSAVPPVSAVVPPPPAVPMSAPPVLPFGPMAVPAVAAGGAGSSSDSKEPGSGKPPPSPYCDFCLGDERDNKKTGIPEGLTSCSDCGRSGKHQTKRKTTPNTPISNCIHQRICEYHKQVTSDYKVNGLVEVLTSMTYLAADFDSFASKTRILEPDVLYVDSPPMSPPSRQSPGLPEVFNGNDS